MNSSPLIAVFKKELAIFEEKLKASENIVIVHHYNPDGDAIGSSLGLFNALVQTGKNVKVLSPTAFPDNLRFLPGSENIVVPENEQVAADLFSAADMIVCLDMNARNRLGAVSKVFENANVYKVVFDHHPYVETFTDLAIFRTEYSSTCELVCEMIENTFLNQYFNKDVATCLYAGILTDTGSFQYNSSNPNLFRNLGTLMELGIEKDKIYNALFNSWSEDRIRFMGFAACYRMVVMPEYKTAYIYITAADRRKFNEHFGDTENFVNIPMQIKGIVFTAIFIERDNFIKASFRSKGKFDVNKFSSNHFGGAGHVNASGGESHESLRKTCEKFESLVKGVYGEELKNYIY
ncbi:MAG: bifunctional oligoribonuclease/PAP phosphatase NrnA [Bacteroidales bacterium]|nr:bifunctional oligoribonuclease/PAP phosphatase NrnA [Bacteroidales bacterium]